MNWHKVFETAADAARNEADISFINGAEDFARFAADNTIWRDLAQMIDSRIVALLEDLETLGKEVTEDGQLVVPTVADFAHIQGELFAWRSIRALPMTLAQTLLVEGQESHG